MNNIVSIIIPAYNAAKYIEQTLDAVVKQTYKSIEVVVVNDGSSDNTSAVAKSFMANKGIDYRVVDKSNGGQSSARNYGAKMSRGQFLTFLDSDDYIQPYYIERLLSVLRESDVDFAACPFQNVGESDFEREPRYDNGNKWYDTVELAKLYLHRGITLIAPALLIKHETLDAISFDESCPYDEDGLFVWSLLYSTKKGAYCDCPMYNYRIREGSVMHSLTAKKCHQSVTCYEKHSKYFIRMRRDGVSQLILPNYKLASQHVLSKNVDYKAFKEEYDLTEKADIKLLISVKDIKLSFFALLYLISPRLFYVACRRI